MNDSDTQALTRWIENRDADAFRSIVLQHGGMVYATCRRILCDASEAEDVAQECFEGLARNPKKAPVDYLGPWLHRVATNRALQRVRSLSRRRDREKKFMPNVTESSNSDLDDTYKFVDKAIAGLPEKLRVPVVSYFLEGRTQNDIAQELGVSRQTVTDRVRLGVERIRAALKRMGVTVTSAALTGLLESGAAEAAPAGLIEAMGKLALSGGTVKAGLIAWSWVTIAKTGAVALVATVAGIVALQPWNQTPQSEPISPDSIATPQPVESLAVTPDQADVPDANASPLVAVTRELPTDRGVTVSGMVVLPNGRAAAEASVTAFTEEDRESFHFGLTNAAGRFEFSGFLGDEEISVFAELDELKSRTEGPIPLTKEGMEGLDLALMKTGGVRGIVVDSTGTPMPDVELRFRGEIETGPEARAISATDGGFEQLRLLPGQYGPGISVPGPRSPVSMEGAVFQVYSDRVREDVRIVLDMGGDAFIAGRVTDPDGKPIEKAHIQIESGSGWYARTDAEGRYRIEGVSRAQTYCLMAQSTEYVHGKICNVAPDSENADFVLKRDAASLQGRVVRAIDGAPVPEFGIWTVAGGGVILSVKHLESLPFDTFKDDEGRFRKEDFHHYGGGWTTIIARAPGYAIGYEQARVNPDGPTSEIIIRLEAEAFVDGIVVDEKGEPVPGTRIVIGELENSGNAVHETAALTHADGTFELGGLSGDTRVVSAYHPDFAIETVEVAPTPGTRQHVRILLSQGGTIEGFVTADGKPLAEANIFVHAPGLSGQTLDNTKSDRNGRYRITDVSSNEDLEISAFHPEGFAGIGSADRLIRKVVVRNDAVSRVDFNFERHTGVIEGRVAFEGELNPDGFAWLFIDDGSTLNFRTADIKNGFFQFANLPSGSARLRATAFFPDMRHVVRKKTVKLTLIPNGHIETVIDFASGGIVSGHIDALARGESAYVDIFEGEYTADELNDSETPYNELAWQGPADKEGAFHAQGFSSGVYTVRISISDDNAPTVTEQKATFRTASQIVSISGQENVNVQFSAR